MRHFCTCFDIRFLSRGLALYESLVKNCDAFTLYILAFDSDTVAYFNNHPKQNIKIISIADYIEYFNIDVNKYHDKKQFYFSATPNLCLYVLQNHPSIDILFYLDADVYFFNTTEYLYQELGHHSIGICGTNLHKVYKKLANNHGNFNVGVNGFRNNEEGLRCLQDWKVDCESWYPKKPGYPLSYFSDQIFLDTWPSRYKNLKIFSHKGINTAPWNVLNYKVKMVADTFYIDNDPLVVFHFSTLLKVSKTTWNANLNRYFVHLNGNLKELYQAYIRVVESFGIKNDEVAKLTYQASYLKRLIKNTAKLLMNEEVKL